jgi:hypothetical protein
MAGGMVRVFRPTDKGSSSAVSCQCTTPASQVSRRDVSAGTWAWHAGLQLRFGADAGPPFLPVKGLDQHQEAVFAGIEMGGQFGDLVAEADQFCLAGEAVLHGFSPLQSTI